MIDIVINFDKTSGFYKVYEKGTDTLLITKNLTEALAGISNHLVGEGLIKNDITNSQDINYHLDSESMINIIKSNVELLKKLQAGPSAFTIANQRFGGSGKSGLSSTPPPVSNKNKGSKSFGMAASRRGSSKFSGKSSFDSGYKKFY